MTNATKASIIAVLNAGLQLVTAFGVELTDAQNAAITAFVNAALVLWVAVTYQNSPKRISE